MALPVIKKQPKSTVVEVNSIAIFDCTARSYGTASITWKRMKSQLPITTNVTVTKSLNEISSFLRIEKTIGYYEGYYYCVIENSVGQVNSSLAYCNVEGTYIQYLCTYIAIYTVTCRHSIGLLKD